MKIQTWIALAVTYVLLVGLEVLASYYLGHVLLQMPLMDVYIITGFLILAVTLGMLIAIAYLIKRKEK